MTRHYHVFTGTPGYLPDNEPEIYTTLRDARDALRWHRDGWADMIADQTTHIGEWEQTPWKIRGSLRKGYFTIDRGRYSLDYNMTIDPCTDATCLDEYDPEGW